MEPVASVPPRLRVLVTGASGLLGRAVYKEFSRRGHDVVGTAFSRARPPLVQLDLDDHDAVKATVNRLAPDVVVHCAAERRPDVCELQRDHVLKLNVGASKCLAETCSAAPKKPYLIYISTDYVFDGRNAPYEVDDKPNPLNFYGQSKLRGEEATLGAHSNCAVLRVPVLYGEAEREDESAVNALVKPVKDQKPAKMDDYAIRYPTNVSDVARIIVDLSEKRCLDHADATGVLHFSAPQKMTKYDMCKVFSGLLGLPIEHISAESDAPVSATANRPYDCHLSNRKLVELGISCECVDFKEWWALRLQ